MKKRVNLIININGFIIVRKKEENTRQVLQERSTRLRERNEELNRYVRDFKTERDEMLEKRSLELTEGIFKTEMKMVSYAL